MSDAENAKRKPRRTAEELEHVRRRFTWEEGDVVPVEPGQPAPPVTETLPPLPPRTPR